MVPTVAVQHDGARGLAAALAAQRVPLISRSAAQLHAPGIEDVMLTQREVQRIVQEAVQAPAHPLARDDAIDRVLLHPLGVLVLAAVLLLMFQAVFSWPPRPWTGSRRAWTQPPAS